MRYRQVEAEPGRIAIPNFEAPVGLDSTVRIPYRVEGDFPLGTVSRTVELRAPELAAPVTVRFEVTSRRQEVLIPILVVLAVLLGLLVRVLIPAVLDAVRARRRGVELAGELQALREEHEDEAFRVAIDRAILRLSHLPWRTSKLSAEVDTARSQAEQALEELREALAEQSDRLRAFAAVLVPDWRLPAALRDDLRDSRRALECAEARLERSYAEGAKEALDALAATWADDIVPKTEHWAAAYRHGLELVRDVAGARTAGALGALAYTANAALAVLPARGVRVDSGPRGRAAPTPEPGTAAVAAAPAHAAGPNRDAGLEPRPETVPAERRHSAAAVRLRGEAVAGREVAPPGDEFAANEEPGQPGEPDRAWCQRRRRRDRQRW